MYNNAIYIYICNICMYVCMYICIYKHRHTNQETDHHFTAIGKHSVDGNR